MCYSVESSANTVNYFGLVPFDLVHFVLKSLKFCEVDSMRHPLSCFTLFMEHPVV